VWGPERTGRMAGGVDVAVEGRAALGEGPRWWASGEQLLWVDIEGHALHRFTPRTGVSETSPFADAISLVVPRRGGGFATAVGRSVVLLDEGLGEVGRIPVEEHVPGNRCNDGGCDAAGRLWVGTMRGDGRGAQGALYRVDPSGAVERRESGLGIANGIGWSPDGRRMYHIDSLARRVAVYDYDVDSGTATDRRDLVVVPDEQGYPDGMAVDDSGCLWVAFYDGWAVRRYRPDGAVDRRLDLPVQKVTSCAFGGADLSDLYVTTATSGLDGRALADQPLAGSVLRLEVGARGVPLHEFAG
jgi:sugar lactone lactonase YvrE